MRIIPAYAGLTGLNSVRNLSGGDHPRLRGVNARTSRATAWTTGSSPLTRG